jgi:endonuclease/exonuclease/phosphatase family metal-dependent hydrolase
VSGPIVTVATYNIRSMRGDTAALARVITSMRPDVLCLQEAPRFWSWRRRRRWLAHVTGMTVAAGRRTGGLAVLAGPEVRVINAESRLLRGFLGMERRATTVLVAEKHGRRVAVCCVHLDLLAAARLRHAAEAVVHLRKACERYGALPVLAGDINEEPGRPTFEFIARRFADTFAAAPIGDGATFTARHPRKRIDAIFAGAGLTAVSCGVPAAEPADLSTASDHLPMRAELRFHHDLGERRHETRARPRTISS